MNPNLDDKTILFFDGDCALCNFWVQFCSERNFKKNLFFAPLQGITAQALLPTNIQNDNDSVILWKDKKYYQKSEAILKVLKFIGYAPELQFFAKLFPTIFLNRIYDSIAKNRYKWFGKVNTCHLPPESQRRQILN